MDYKYEINEFTMPSIWYDEKQINNYFLPFNPIDDVNKYKFWRNLILEYAEHYHVVLLQADSLNNVFTKVLSNGNRLSSLSNLSSVLSTMRERGDIINYSSSVASTSVVKSAEHWLKKPLPFAGKIFGNSQINSNSQFLIPNLRHKLAIEFIHYLNHHRSSSLLRITPAQPIFSKEIFLNFAQQYFPHEYSRHVAMDYLKTKNYFTEYNINIAGGEFTLVQINENPQQPQQQGKTQHNNELLQNQLELLATILFLRQTSKQLDDEINQLLDTIATRYQQVKTLLKSQRKDEAKVTLRRAKLSEKLLSQKQARVRCIDQGLTQLEGALHNRDMIAALKVAKNAHLLHLPTQNDSSMTNTDALADLLNDNNDVIHQQDEIADALSTSYLNNDNLSELEEELDELLKDDQQIPPHQHEIPEMKMSKMQEKRIDEALSQLDFSNIQLPDVSQLPPPSSTADEQPQRVQNKTKPQQRIVKMETDV